MLVDPIRQFALKGTEQATVAATYTNVDSVLWTSRFSTVMRKSNSK